MDSAEIKRILEAHKEWLADTRKGERADLSGADLRGADLRGADLQGADLQGADLEGADLQGADLKCADLRGADLEGADLQGANLRGANLHRADLRVANLVGANFDFSCLPLWCGGLGLKVDVEFKKMIAYFLVRMSSDDAELDEYINTVLKDVANEASVIKRHNLPEIK